MYSLLVFATVLFCSVSCDEIPPANPVGPVSVPDAPIVPGVLVQSVPNESPPVPVQSDVNVPAVAPDPPAILTEPSGNAAPPGSVIFAGTNTSEVNTSLANAENNVTLKVAPNSVDNEKPELSERKQNIPGLLYITPDSVRNVLGANCVNDDNCTVPYSVCIAKNCYCKEGYRPSKVKLEACVPIPKALNDECQTTKECDQVISKSECILNKCVCPPDFIADGGACWEYRALGATCETTVQCSEIVNAACLQGVCACPADFVPSPTSNKCLKRAEPTYMAECIEDIQCTETMGDNARCNDNGCICKENHHLNGSICIVDQKLGSLCNNKEDCSVSLLTEPADQRTCKNNNCTCATGFRVFTGEDKCVKGAADQIAISLSWMICVVIAKYFI